MMHVMIQLAFKDSETAWFQSTSYFLSSGFNMDQNEMEQISDNFDTNKSGFIDLAEVTAILQPVHKQGVVSEPAKPVSDEEKIDLEVSFFVYEH